jgi:hypothetical protein
MEDFMTVSKKLISEITGMIEREGEGMLNDEGADLEVAKGIADDIVGEIIKPLLIINAELLKSCKIALERLRINDCEGEESRFIGELEDVIAKAEA